MCIVTALIVQVYQEVGNAIYYSKSRPFIVLTIYYIISVNIWNELGTNYWLVLAAVAIVTGQVSVTLRTSYCLSLSCYLTDKLSKPYQLVTGLIGQLLYATTLRGHIWYFHWYSVSPQVGSMTLQLNSQIDPTV